LNKVMLLFPHCFWGDKVCWLCFALMSAARCSCLHVAFG
jgi:hypothetical protein